MIVVVAKVRRDHFVHKKGIKEICRDRGISRNSVRKILRSKVTEFGYDRSTQPLPKLGLFTEQLDTMLKANERCSRKERLTLTRIHDDLRRVGYDGSYDSVRRYAKRWRNERSTGLEHAFVPLSFAHCVILGRSLPVRLEPRDWSHEIVVTGASKVKVAISGFATAACRFW